VFPVRVEERRERMDACHAAVTRPSPVELYEREIVIQELLAEFRIARVVRCQRWRELLQQTSKLVWPARPLGSTAPFDGIIPLDILDMNELVSVDGCVWVRRSFHLRKCGLVRLEANVVRKVLVGWFFESAVKIQSKFAERLVGLLFSVVCVLVSCVGYGDLFKVRRRCLGSRGLVCVLLCGGSRGLHDSSAVWSLFLFAVVDAVGGLRWMCGCCCESVA
jgi:hypothetical protein